MPTYTYFRRVKKGCLYILVLLTFACHKSEDSAQTESAEKMAIALNFNGQMIKDIIQAKNIADRLNINRVKLDTTDQIDSIRADSTDLIYNIDTVFHDSVQVNDSMIDSIRLDTLSIQYGLDTFYHIENVYYQLNNLDSLINRDCGQLSIRDTSDNRILHYQKSDACVLSPERSFEYTIRDQYQSQQFEVTVHAFCFYDYCLKDSISFSVNIEDSTDFQISTQYEMTSDQDTIRVSTQLLGELNINILEAFQLQQIRISENFSVNDFEGTIDQKIKLNYNCDQIKEGSIVYTGEGDIEKELILKKTDCQRTATLKVGRKEFNIYYGH